MFLNTCQVLPWLCQALAFEVGGVERVALLGQGWGVPMCPPPLWAAALNGLSAPALPIANLLLLSPAALLSEVCTHVSTHACVSVLPPLSSTGQRLCPSAAVWDPRGDLMRFHKTERDPELPLSHLF